MALLALCAYFCVNSTSFHRFMLARIVEQANQATGGTIEIAGIDFRLSGLTASLSDITLRGSGSSGQTPLLHADKLTFRIKIVSALRPRLSLSELLIVHPVIHIQVNRNGKNNFPTPPSSQTSNYPSIFDLGVAHLQITSGEVEYNDQRIPLDADLYDLDTNIRFTSPTRSYDGVVSYRNGRLRYGTYAPLSHNFDVRFSANAAQLTVQSANLRVGSSRLILHAQLSDYSHPVGDGDYSVFLHTQDFAELSPAAKLQGNVSLAGKLHYQAVENQPTLRNIAIDGHLASEELAADAFGKRLELRTLAGDYRLSSGDLIVRDLSIDILGGQIRASGEMKHLDSTPDSFVRTSAHGVSLRMLQRSYLMEQIKGTMISGSLDGSAEAAWKGSGFETLKARSDLTLRAQASSTANPSEVPVNGTLHVTFDGARQSLEMHDCAIKIPAATVNAQGILSDHSNLQVQVVANDLQQLEQVTSWFVATQNPAPAVSGKATLNAVVQGSLKRPMVSAQLSAANLHVQESEWTTVALAMRANPSELSVENGRLKSARRGQASFNAKVQLNQWAYEPSSRIQAHLDAEQFRITDLLDLANQQYPISGVVTARLSMDGSQIDAAGNGQIEIANAIFYGEPIQKVMVNLQTKNRSLMATVGIMSKCGNVDGDLWYEPKTKAYKVRVDAPSMLLQHLQAVQKRNLQLTGTVAASIHGEGSMDDPQLTAMIQLPKLQAGNKVISQLNGEARIAQHRLDVSMDSKIAQVSVHAQGQVALSGDYDAQVSVDTGTIALETLLATYAANLPVGFQSQTELHATLHGPLKDKTRLEAHVSIPVLKASYQTLQLEIKNPIQADYANSVVTLQPVDIDGTGGSFHLQGQVPITGTRAPTMTARGTVNLNILKILSPDLNSSGQMALDVRVAGTASAPDIQGQLELKNVALAAPDVPIGVEKLNGTFEISSNRVQVSKMTAVMGGGQVSIGGAITYRPDLQFNLALQCQSVRLPRPEGLRTLLDASLMFNGNMTASTLSGRVSVGSLSFLPDFNLSTFADQFASGNAISQPGLADAIKLAIVVQTPQTLSATTSEISIGGQAALRVGGTAATPVITGRMTLTSGELFYRTVRYQLQRGVITFDDSNNTHPVLNVAVTTTIEQYNLTLTLRGPLEKLTTSYVSDPPLATADIINLVARGKTIQQSAGNSQSTDAMLASQAASKFSGSLQKLAGLSSLQIDPTISGTGQNPSARIALQQRVTKNLLFTFSTDVSEPGHEVIQGEYQINRRWSVSASRNEAGGVSVDARYHKKF
jgi:translocation and assembly module TamB